MQTKLLQSLQLWQEYLQWSVSELKKHLQSQGFAATGLHDFSNFIKFMLSSLNLSVNSGDVSCFACSCRFPINRTSAFIAGSKKNLVDRLLTLSETDSPISLSPKKLKEMTEKS